ncbi:MAG: hypothetical protein V4590_11220 [Bacteroidota bacterium]
MNQPKTIFLYPDYYDATTATIRILSSSKDLFNGLTFFYWAKTGVPRSNKDKLFDNIDIHAFTKTARPRSLGVLFLFVSFQFWLLKNIIKSKPQVINSFMLYTIFPALIYKYCFNWKCKVIYDPRDYVAVCYDVNKVIIFFIQLIDNIVMQLADFVIFPDNQYFSYYGFFKLRKSKYYILPNSTEDQYDLISTENIYTKYGIPQGTFIVPLIGYFSETRGKKLFFEIIKENVPNVHFVVAGDFRDETDVNFFKSNKNVSFLGKVSYIESLYIMKNATFTPLLYDPVSLNNRYAYPTKYYDSLMVGTPLLTSFGQIDLWNSIQEFQIGYGIEYNNTNEFKHILLNLSDSEFDRQKIRKLFIEKYDFNLFRDGLRNVYGQFLAKK